MKDELGAKIMTKFVGLSANTHSYLIYDEKTQKTKRHKKVHHKRKIKFKDYKNCLEATQIENEIKHFEKK